MMNMSEFLQLYPEYEDLSPKELAAAVHAKFSPGMHRNAFDAEFLGDINYVDKQEPFSEKRLNFEIGLVKNPKTSKAAVMLPDTAPLSTSDVVKIAKEHKLMALKENGSVYLFDPKQVKEAALRKAVRAGKEGHLLGYGTDGVPEDGTDYAINLDGHGAIDRDIIKEWRDADHVGFAGRAPDESAAVAKIKEMGRDDATIAGYEEPLETANYT